MSGTERKKRYLSEHNSTLLDVLPTEIGQLEAENGDFEVDEIVSLRGRTSSDVVLIDESIPQKSWESAQRLPIKMLDEAMSSFSKPPRETR